MLEPDTQLNHYKVLSPLGKGGMGEVYLAEDSKLQRKVALKVLPTDMASDEDRLSRFQREARAVAALNHPNIVTIYSVEDDDGVHFLTMELVDGQPLSKLVVDGGLSAKRFREIAIPLAEAVAAAHAKGITHRDIKPPNVMITSDGRVKVLDFGLARFAASSNDAASDVDSDLATEARTREGVIVGTAPYMSPEQVSGRAVDPRSDIFSLGIVLFEMATGRRPFKGDNAIELLSSILKDEPPRARELVPELPEHLSTIISRCLTKDPSKRYQDARELLRDLLPVGTTPFAVTSVEGAPAEAPRIAVQGITPASREMAPPRRKGLSLLLGSLIILSALIAYFVASSALRPTAESDTSSVPQTAGDVPEALPFGGRPAIAVLPFDNLSPDPEQAFFADGLAEDLITRLSSWRAFPVIARNSSFQYRGGSQDLKQVSAELGARYLLEGSVRRAGDQIRVTAQLIDAPTDHSVWAQTYDRAITDLFTMQDEISSTIAASLIGDLTRAEGERAHQRGTEDLEAWSLYQLGMQRADRFTLEEYGEARKFFAQAVERDPRFATALAQHALSTVMEIMLGSSGVRDDMVSAAFDSARRAVALDARDPTAHAALGGAYLVAGDPNNGVDSTQRAVDLNPSMPEAWIWLGWANVLAGNPEAAIIASERAQRLNPHGNYMVWIYENLAVAYWEVGRYEEGLELARQLVAMNPTYFTGYAYIAMNALALGDLAEARAAIVAGRGVRPDLSLALIQGYFGVSRPAFDARRDDALRQAGLE